MPKRLTVLQIIPRLNAGGAELGCVQIAEALLAAGHRAIVASQGGRLVDRLTAAGGEHIELPVATKNPLSIWRNSRTLAAIAVREGVDILHARSRSPAWSALWASRRAGTRFVTTYHSAYREQNRLKNRYNRVMVAGDKVIAVSDHMAELIRERYGTPENRIAIIHRCIDPAQFDVGAVTAERLAQVRQLCDIGEDQKVILMAARISRRKVQHHLVEAAGILAQRGRTDFVCVFAGEEEKPGYLAELRRQAAALGVADRIRFPGHLKDMAAANRIAHVAINIAAFEGLPRVALEAQAMGTPVIVSDTGPGREVARTAPDVAAAEATGLRVGFGQPAGLAEALTTLLDIPEAERLAMGLRGMNFVRGRYTLDRMQALTLAVYDEVTADRDKTL